VNGYTRDGTLVSYALQLQMHSGQTGPRSATERILYVYYVSVNCTAPPPDDDEHAAVG
jgi:hypothetical protein